MTNIIFSIIIRLFKSQRIRQLSYSKEPLPVEFINYKKKIESKVEIIIHNNFSKYYTTVQLRIKKKGKRAS